MRGGDYCPLIWKVVISIIVTGVCGFFGTNFVKGLLSVNNEKLVNIDKLTMRVLCQLLKSITKIINSFTQT